MKRIYFDFLYRQFDQSLDEILSSSFERGITLFGVVIERQIKVRNVGRSFRNIGQKFRNFHISSFVHDTPCKVS